MSYVDGGFWVKLEILNIPWNESLLDFNTDYFDKAKLFIEKVVRIRLNFNVLPRNGKKITFLTLRFNRYKSKLFFQRFQFDNRFLAADENEVMDPFKEGYVRTIAMQFKKGQSKLNDVWEAEYNVTNANITTRNASTLEEVTHYNYFNQILPPIFVVSLILEVSMGHEGELALLSLQSGSI